VLPLDDALRARLLGLVNEPGNRLIVLLAGVHALRPSQICALTLDAIRPADSTLFTGGRAQPLDRLTAGHLRAWLQARRASLARHRQPASADQPEHRRRSQAGQPQLYPRSHAPGRHHRQPPARRPAPG
jgi:integrase